MSALVAAASAEPVRVPGRALVVFGDAVRVLRTLPTNGVACCVTSPPYFNQRVYGGGPAEIGCETNVDAYLARLVEVFGEVRRVLKTTGTLWLNLGDTFNGYAGNRGAGTGSVHKHHHDRMPQRPTGYGLTEKTLKNK